MNKEILNKIEALEAELQKLKNEVKPKFEVGKWYKTAIEKSFVFLNKPYEHGAECYGINGSGEWTNRWYCKPDSDNLLPANHQEVEEALIKEAKKRGFKKGVRFKSALYKHDCVITTYEFDFHFDYMVMCKNVLFCNDNAIFSNGVWAEIVKDELIKIGGYEVRKKGDYYFIGCKTIGKELIENLQILMQSQNFKKVSFDGVEIDIEIINKILAL